MKSSELIEFLTNLSDNIDPDIVTGEAWLPEQLIDASYDGEMVHLSFDNAPEDEDEFEGRGFVDHEITMIRDKIVKLMFDPQLSPKQKSDIFLELFLLAHEKSSTEVIEILEKPTHSQSSS